MHGELTRDADRESARRGGLDLGREAGLDSRGGALSLSVGWCHVRDAGGVRCGELSDGVMRRACDGES